MSERNYKWELSLYKLKILGIFCFPLDLELTSFGTLHKLAKAGHQVHVVVVGNTITSWTSECKHLLYESCKKMHIDNILFTEKFDYSSVTQDNALVLNSIIRQVVPELVIIPFWKSHNYKHRVLSRTSLIACRGIGNIIMYEFSNNTKFNANICVSLSETEASTKLDSLLEYWPLINRKFLRGNRDPISRKISILQKSDQIVSTENIRREIASFLVRRVYQGRCLLESLNNKSSGSQSNISTINSGTDAHTQVQNFTFSQKSELSEIFEGHRVLLA